MGLMDTKEVSTFLKLQNCNFTIRSFCVLSRIHSYPGVFPLLSDAVCVFLTPVRMSHILLSSFFSFYFFPSSFPSFQFNYSFFLSSSKSIFSFKSFYFFFYLSFFSALLHFSFLSLSFFIFFVHSFSLVYTLLPLFSSPCSFLHPIQYLNNSTSVFQYIDILKGHLDYTKPSSNSGYN